MHSRPYLYDLGSRTVEQLFIITIIRLARVETTVLAIAHEWFE